MRVRVKLFASLREGRFEDREMELPAGTSVGALADLLEVPRGEMAVVFVNGRHAGLDRLLEEGDVLGAFPPVGGG